MRKRVTIFVCGVQKGGTTSLYAYLREHPALSPPRRKEVHFFDDDARDWAAPDYADLDAFFDPNDGARLRFDRTPIYSFWPPSVARIHAYNPAAKLIFLFRDPFERAWSHWCMEYARGNEVLPFTNAIREGRERLNGLPEYADERRIYTYLERGFYSEQVRRALTYFRPDQLLFLRSQDLLNDHVGTLGRVTTFLDIPPFDDPSPKRENMRSDFAFPSVPTDSDRMLVANVLRDDFVDFSVLTGLDVSDWPAIRNASAMATQLPKALQHTKD